jgi:hypothetical protein
VGSVLEDKVLAIQHHFREGEAYKQLYSNSLLCYSYSFLRSIDVLAEASTYKCNSKAKTKHRTIIIRIEVKRLM